MPNASGKLLVFALLVCVCAQSPADVRAQQTMKQKPGHLECWIQCCPLKIECKWAPNTATARRSAPQTQVTVNSKQMTVEFTPKDDKKVYEVTQATKLDAQTAEALGYKEITVLPGKYPLTPLANGRMRILMSTTVAR